DYDVLCFNVSQGSQTSEKCAQVRIGIGGSKQQNTDAPNPLGLLSAHTERPPRRRPAKQRDELAPFHRCNHSITSSARARRVAGSSMPIAFAVLTLIKNL